MELTRKLSAAAAEGAATAPSADQPAIFRIKGMNVAEKMRLAPMADRHQRQVLLRDSSAQVLLALLNNPHLQNDDVMAIVKSTHASGGVLQRVAKDRRWAANPEVQAALARNPKTPSPIAVQMVEVLRTGDLRDLAKSRLLRENVRKAALRVYLKRSGQG